jgi:hypothetical protein
MTSWTLGDTPSKVTEEWRVLRSCLRARSALRPAGSQNVRELRSMTAACSRALSIWATGVLDGLGRLRARHRSRGSATAGPGSGDASGAAERRLDRGHNSDLAVHCGRPASAGKPVARGGRAVRMEHGRGGTNAEQETPGRAFPIRVALVGCSGVLGDIIRRAVREAPDMRVVSEASHFPVPGDALEERAPDVDVVLWNNADEAPADGRGRWSTTGADRPGRRSRGGAVAAGAPSNVAGRAVPGLACRVDQVGGRALTKPARPTEITKEIAR